jgi:lipopolysaccharide export LptBFGC system permease protein LptF
VALGVSDFLRRQNKFIRPSGEMDLSEMPKAAADARAAGDLANARRIEVAYHGKFAALLTCFVFGLIGIPLAAAGRSSRGAGFAATVLAFAGYYVVQTIANGLGEGGRISAPVAAWIPNILGVLVAAALTLRIRRGPMTGVRK